MPPPARAIWPAPPAPMTRCAASTSRITSASSGACGSSFRWTLRRAPCPPMSGCSACRKARRTTILFALYFQYGRYLLIASSRPGSMAANLQGKWNDSLTPSWGSKYTININTEMNYWPAETCNLSELHEPLFDLIENGREDGRRVAKFYYGAGGFVLHHNTDLWGDAVPIDGARCGIWPMGAAWLSLHLAEHYDFTRDRKFLAERAYPIMKEAAQFFLDYLVSGRQGASGDGPFALAGERIPAAVGREGRPHHGTDDGHRDSSGVLRARDRGQRDSRDRRGFPGEGSGGAREADAAAHRPVRPNPGMAGRLRRGGARAPAHVPSVRPVSRRPDYAAQDAGTGQGRPRHDRAAVGQRRRTHGLEPRLDHQFLDPAGRWRESVREPGCAAAQVHAAEPVRQPPAVSDRRQLRRRRPRSPRCSCKATPAN